jgi:hypothetical protein
VAVTKSKLILSRLVVDSSVFAPDVGLITPLRPIPRFSQILQFKLIEVETTCVKRNLAPTALVPALTL